MPSKTKKSAPKRDVKKTGANADARSNAAEERRMAAKSDRVRTFMAESRAREAELEAKGYFF